MLFQQSGTPVNLSAAGIVSSAPGTLLGFYVNSTSSGVIKIYDGTTTGGTLLDGNITPAIGWREFPAQCNTGCYIDLVSGAINLTAIFAAN